MVEDRRDRPVRCAIYTRKSTEEGLDQAFNSLHAQREACTAYVLSQRHEGWQLVPELYDDGGFSGGNMDRPGLKQLLADVTAGCVDVIVVYKVDRLTRSLADFAKIVEVLDARGASFVSVTQAFNTTTSMGRLTLNVLLSFAQFEREVTGERIRDKIAASKRKGLFMGGTVPLGYDVVDRKLVVNAAEAKTVRHIFQRYVELQSLEALAAELAARGIRSKARPATASRKGAMVMTTGALSHILRNRTYRGEAVHKGQAYPGEHDAIVPPELWEAAARTLAAKRVARRSGGGAVQPSLLAGLLQDPLGRRMTPDHATKGRRRYRYYVSHRAPDDPGHAPAVRLPAAEIERAVIARLRAFLKSSGEIARALDGQGGDGFGLAQALTHGRQLAAQLLDAQPARCRCILSDLIAQVRVLSEAIEIDVHAAALVGDGVVPLGAQDDARCITLTAPIALRRRGGELRLVVPGAATEVQGARDPSLVGLLVRARAAQRAVLRDPARPLEAIAAAQGYGKAHLTRLLRLAYLAPEIVGAIVEGRQPVTLTAQRLMRTAPLPSCWQEQKRLLQLA